MRLVDETTDRIGAQCPFGEKLVIALFESGDEFILLLSNNENVVRTDTDLPRTIVNIQIYPLLIHTHLAAIRYFPP